MSSYIAMADALPDRITRMENRLAALEAYAKAHEAWEARLILGPEIKLLDALGDDAYGGMMEVQRLRNVALRS